MAARTRMHGDVVPACVAETAARAGGPSQLSPEKGTAGDVAIRIGVIGRAWDRGVKGVSAALEGGVTTRTRGGVSIRTGDSNCLTASE